jgi:FlgD Ig-like domain
MRMRWTRLGIALAIALPSAGLATAARAQGVHAALLPALQNVTTGDTLTLDLFVPAAGSSFNGFDGVVGYDPSALTFLPLSPTSLQQGTYMTSACGSTFHQFHAAADSLSITDVLLCGGVSLPGPGQIYHLRFKASSTPQSTTVHVRHVQFYNAGLLVNPSTGDDAQISIGVPVGVGPSQPLPLMLSIRAAPNPSRGQVTLSIETRQAGGQRLEVQDVAGRTVRHLQAGEYAAGLRQLAWDGRDDQGRTLPAGVYRVAAYGTSGAGRATTLITLLR